MIYTLLTIIWVIASIWLIKAILSTPKGAYALLLLPGALLAIRLNYLWDLFSQSEEIFLPNPFCPEGFLNDIFSDFLGRLLDNIFHVKFFAKAFTWLLGAIDYVTLFTGLHYLFFIFYIERHFDSYGWSWLGLVFFIVWLLFFHHMFYNRGFNSWHLNPLSMPDKVSSNFISYYWISMFLSLTYVLNYYWKRIF